MKKKALGWAISVLLTLTSLLANSSAAEAASLCDESASRENYCMLDDADTGSTYYGRAGEIKTCDNTYYGIKLNTGDDSLEYVELNGVGRDGVVTAGATVTATVRMNQECRSWAGAYGATLTLEGLVNQPIVATQISDKFTYREKYSGRLDSYCFTEICGFSFWEFSFQVPTDFKRDLLNLKANIFAKNPGYVIPPKTLTYSEVFSLGPRLKNPNGGSVDHSITEVEGRMLCFTSDASAAATSDFGITKFEFEIVSYVRGAEKIVDRGLWTLGVPPNNFATEKLANGEASSVVVNGDVQHAYYLSEQTAGTSYGCKVRALTEIGQTPWTVEKIVASRTAKGGVVQARPNVKVLCAKLNKTYQGGVALSSKSKNAGAKAKYKPKVSVAIYQRNIILDIDGDGIACER